MKYIQRKDGEGWAIKNGIPFVVSCCDCGLVHNLVVCLPSKRRGVLLGIAASRNERATAQKRRKFPASLKKLVG